MILDTLTKFWIQPAAGFVAIHTYTNEYAEWITGNNDRRRFALLTLLRPSMVRSSPAAYASV